MAASIATTKVNGNAHSRSIRLPSRSHPFTASVEQLLCRLRTAEETTSSISKSNRLSVLKDLYVCVEDLLQSPAAQQDYLSCREDILCGSLRLLDLCSTSKDALSQMRASVQDLESSLRRRETDLSRKAGSYLICKKKAYEMISKCISSFKTSKTNKSIGTPVVGLLREVEEVSITVFESIFSSICPLSKKMAASITTTKVSTHSRSISLPSRSHPLTATVQEHLCRLRSSEEASSSSPSKKLSALQDLYECLEDLIQSPVVQQDLMSCGEDILCRSIRLLDMCSTSKDALSQIKASVQDLESSLRRREASVSSEAGSYTISKKKAYKIVSKCFASYKKLKINKSIETPATVSLLREVEEVSITVFESIFSSICPAKKTSNKWSMVFKPTQSKRVHCEGNREENIHQIQDMDMALEALNKKSSKINDIIGTQEVQKCLTALDTIMQDCEEKLDCLVRSLIKTRVSILNVLNH